MLPNSSVLNRAMLDVLRENPDGLSSRDIDTLTSQKLGLSQVDLSIIRSGSRTEFAYRMAWERTHAKAKGFITKHENRIWKITESGKTVK